MSTTADMVAPGNYPSLWARRIEAPNRIWAFPILGIIVKSIILIPVFVWAGLLSAVLMVVSIMNSLQVLFTGRYWDAAYSLGLGLLRLQTKIIFYLAGLTDGYPGFSLTIPSEESFGLDIPRPESPSRGFALPILGGVVRGVLLIPYSLWVQVVFNGAFLALVVASVSVLFLGRYPASSFELVRDCARLLLSGDCYCPAPS